MAILDKLGADLIVPVRTEERTMGENQEPREDTTVISVPEDANQDPGPTRDEEIAAFYENVPGLMPASKFSKRYCEFMACKQEARKLQSELAKAEKALPEKVERADEELEAILANHKRTMEVVRTEHEDAVSVLKSHVSVLRDKHNKAKQAAKRKADGLTDLLASDLRNE